MLEHPVLTFVIVAKFETPPICPVLVRAHSGQYSQSSFRRVGGGEGGLEGEGEVLQPKVKDHKRAKMSSFTPILVQFQVLMLLSRITNRKYFFILSV